MISIRAMDPRVFQIATLSSLVAVLMLWNDFAPQLEVVALTLFFCCLFQVFFLLFFNAKAPSAPRTFPLDQKSWRTLRLGGKNLLRAGARGIVRTDFRSALVSGLSLSLLLKGPLWIYPPAALLAIGSKFLLRHEGKHIFNPTNFAIVMALLLVPHHTWVSPGQWGSALWLGFFLVSAACLVLFTARRGDMALFFLGCWSALIFGRALWLGDPLAIPLLNLQNGALLIFAFFMISDPKTTPDHVLGRFIFALGTAVVAYILTFVFQVREGLFFALFMVSMSTPVIDGLFKAQRYEWRKA